MALIDTALATTHLVVGALWVGSVVFFAVVVLPAARGGTLNAEPLDSMAGSLTRGSRVAAVVMFLTGGHLTGTRYTFETLASTTNGNLVLVMLALWLGLTALVEVGSSRLRDGLDRKKVREPAANALGLFRGAAVAGALVFLTAGAIVG
ncbi:copper resistance protein CopD [Salinigranum halophilum]|uniref:copper resistance protein CopD n=1 Tax=Salinigranum halophilum TaxID=2565931 RepID=UPI0010A83E8C|nr:copper resistance protein CopD [Salinigranum halophilum]